MIAAIQSNSSRSNSVFYVPFYVVGDPVVRQARVTKAINKVEKFEHQYKATCNVTTPSATNTSVFYYYADDGINLASITTAEMTGWQCQEDGSVHNGSQITNITGDVTLVPVYASGAGPISGGVIKTDLHTGSIPSVGETFNYEDYSGTSASGSVVFITIPPLPAGTLFTESQSGDDVSWTGYTVTVTIGTDSIPVTFAPGDTQSKVIENIPVGATITATASINVSGGGCTSISTESISLTAQAGGGSTMYVKYPLECHIGDLFVSGGASIAGTNSFYYKNNGTPTDISAAAPTSSYTTTGTSPLTYYFGGWTLDPNGNTPTIAGNLIPADGTYKGKLDLYAVYSPCSVSINEPATRILSEGSLDESLTLSATSNGFSSPVTYTWSIENQNANTPIAVDPSTGVVTIVPGKTGTGVVKVTATDGTYTAHNTISISVAALSLPDGPIVLANNDPATTINASVLGYSGSVDYSWLVSLGTSVSVTNYNSSSCPVTPLEGGKTTISVNASIEGLALATKTIDVYVLDLQLAGSGLDQAGNNYSLMTTMNNTTGTAISASLMGSGMPSTTFTWTNNSSTYLDLLGSDNISRTIKPKAEGAGTVTVSTSYSGKTVSKTINVNVLGLSLSQTGPIILAKNDPTTTITASVPGYSGTVAYHWEKNGNSINVAGTESSNLSVTPVTPLVTGKTTMTLTATSTDFGVLPEKVIEIYVVDFAISGVDYVERGGSVNLTASITGISETPANCTWTTSAANTTATGTGNGMVATFATNADTAYGSVTVTLTGTVGGKTLTATKDITVAGLTLTGGDILYYNPGGTNMLSLDLTPCGGVSLSYLTGDYYTSSNTSVASAYPSGNGVICYVNGLSGGTTNITVKAKISGTDIILTAVKQVTILELIVKKDSTVWSATSSLSLALGENCALAAQLIGASGSVEYSWSKNSDNLYLSATSGESVNVMPIVDAAGTITVSVSAQYNGNTYGPITRSITTTRVLYPDNLSNYLSHQSAGIDAAHPIELPAIQGLTTANWTELKTALQANNTKFVDLSATTLPEGIEDMSDGFSGCNRLVKSPVLPSTVTKLNRCFQYCDLRTAPAIPEHVEDMYSCFECNQNLITVPANLIPSSVTNMGYCFADCTNLTTTPNIPERVTNMNCCFYRDTRLTTAPEIPGSVTSMATCFYNCENLSGTITINTTDVTLWTQCFSGCDANKITKIRVPDATVKTTVQTSISDSTLKAKVYEPNDAEY